MSESALELRLELKGFGIESPEVTSRCRQIVDASISTGPDTVTGYVVVIQAVLVVVVIIIKCIVVRIGVQVDQSIAAEGSAGFQNEPRGYGVVRVPINAAS